MISEVQKGVRQEIMSNTKYILLAVFISTAITYALRALPFVLFDGKHKMPQWMERLGKILPSAIMAVLIVYCLKDAKNNPVGNGIPSIIAVFFLGITYKWRHNTFLSIVSGTALYMILIRFLG